MKQCRKPALTGHVLDAAKRSVRSWRNREENTPSKQGNVMGLGVCRHCNAGRIAADALVCRECGGWKPNPGLFARVGAVLQGCITLAILVVGLAILKHAYFSPVVEEDASQRGYGMGLGISALGLWSLIWSILHPYGKPPC
jgi:ribosomal protein L40E